jgi:hypothetical protein
MSRLDVYASGRVLPVKYRLSQLCFGFSTSLARGEFDNSALRLRASTTNFLVWSRRRRIASSSSAEVMYCEGLLLKIIIVLYRMAWLRGRGSECVQRLVLAKSKRSLTGSADLFTADSRPYRAYYCVAAWQRNTPNRWLI